LLDICEGMTDVLIQTRYKIIKNPFAISSVEHLSHSVFILPSLLNPIGKGMSISKVGAK